MTFKRDQLLLLSCSTLHFIHDGFINSLYVLFPLMAHEFGLSLSVVGVMKALVSGLQSMAQLPAAFIAERVGEVKVLATGMSGLAAGFLFLGFAWSVTLLFFLLAASGFGASVQHPLSSSLISRHYEQKGRGAALGAYNFSGDLGKVAVPALVGVIAAVYGWRSPFVILGVFGLIAASLLWVFARRDALTVASPSGDAHDIGWGIRDKRGFFVLAAIGMLDDSTRTSFLTFLPFVLASKGLSPEAMGLALALVFAGGAAGKFVCGYLGDRIGLVPMVIVTELATGLLILSFLSLPLSLAALLFPVIGIALNGTSSVLYAGVATLVLPNRRSRGYGLYYSLYTGAGAVSPIVYGLIGDRLGLTWAFFILALMIMTAAPLARMLQIKHLSA